MDNDAGIVDYWLAVFPDGAQITAPYFVSTPPITPIDFGKAAPGSLDHITTRHTAARPASPCLP